MPFVEGEELTGIDEMYTCDKCGSKVNEREITYLDEMNLCCDCVDEYTFICFDCQCRHWTDDSVSYDDSYLCINCYESSYINCNNCGRIIHCSDSYRHNNDDEDDEDDFENGYCLRCFNTLKMNAIKSYSYKPEPIFFSNTGNRDDIFESELFMGIELEIDEAGEDEENAETLLEIANKKAEHLYIKKDGSLNCGFELVSHPMTYDYHLFEMPWKKILSKAIVLGYKSHDCPTCGLHIHVGRAAFGSMFEE